MKPFKTLNFDTSDMIFALNEKSPAKPDETGFNELGVVISPNKLLIGQGYDFKIYTKAELKKFSEIRFFNTPKHIKHKEVISKYFNFCWNYPLFRNIGLSALIEKAGVFEGMGFWENLYDLLPEAIIYKSDEEYEKHWEEFIAHLKVGDTIATFDKHSFTSKIIAEIDDGIWSHVGTYAGNGLINEAIPKHGVTKTKIDAYHNQRYRLGIYRFRSITAKELIPYMQVSEALIGEPYSYDKALILGITKIFNVPLSEIPTPNACIYTGLLELIYHL